MRLIKYSEPNKEKKTLFIWPEGVFSGYSYKETLLFKKLISNNFSNQHFIIFGTNDLTSFLLAVDRNNLNLRHMFDEKDKVVQKIISDVIKKSKQKKIKTYLSGSLTENKNILGKFLNDGLTGVTINPDISSINKVKKTIFEIEKKL